MLRAPRPGTADSRVYGSRVTLEGGSATEHENPPTPSFKPVTKDYIKLAPILRLKDWRVMLRDYFGYRLIAPFEHWDTAKPSQSLEWYSAYNAVKHDREGKFEQAQIQFVIEAMAAVHVMLAAQWGPEIHSTRSRVVFHRFK